MATLYLERQLSLGLWEAADHQSKGTFRALASIEPVSETFYREVFYKLCEMKELKKALRRINVPNICSAWFTLFDEHFDFPNVRTVVLRVTPYILERDENKVRVALPFYVPRAQAHQVEKILSEILSEKEKEFLVCCRNEIHLVVTM